MAARLYIFVFCECKSNINNEEPVKNSNEDENKKPVNLELFLFTPEGNKAVLEYMRNLTPQVLVGGVWILFVVRSNSVSNFTLWLVTIGMTFIFFYIVLANIFHFIQQITDHMNKVVKNIPNYKQCDDLYSFRVWSRHLFTTLVLVAKNKKILLVEFILAIVFLLIPTVIVLFASKNSAEQLFKNIFGV